MGLGWNTLPHACQIPLPCSLSKVTTELGLGHPVPQNHFIRTDGERTDRAGGGNDHLASAWEIPDAGRDAVPEVKTGRTS